MPGAKTCVPWITPHRLTSKIALPVLGRAEHAAARLNAGVVHQHVDAAEAISHFAFQRLDFFQPSNIGLISQQVTILRR